MTVVGVCLFVVGTVARVKSIIFMGAIVAIVSYSYALLNQAGWI